MTLKSEQVTETQQVAEHEQCNTPSCPYCKSDNVYGISRVVGYFSIIDNWNNSKKSELKRRQAGHYWDKEAGNSETEHNRR